MAFSTPKTDWANGDIPTAQDFNRIEGNAGGGRDNNKVLWTGSAGAGDTITLSESIYNFRFAIVQTSASASPVIVAIPPSGVYVFRGTGILVTSTVNNFYAINGTLTTATTLSLDTVVQIGLISHSLTPLTVTSVIGVR